MAGVGEFGLDVRAERDDISIGDGAAEAVHRVQGVVESVERRLGRRRRFPAGGLAQVAPRVFLLQPRGVEQHQPREVARGIGGDDLAAKPALDEQRNPAAMVEMRMGQHQHVDRPRVEGERLGVGRALLAPALKHAAIDENSSARRLDQVARSRHAAVRAVEGEFHKGFPATLRLKAERIQPISRRTV